MNRFILLALTAGLISPFAAKAETWYLLVNYGQAAQGWSNSWTVPTTSEDECNREKIKVVNRDNWHMWKKLKDEKLSAICIKGK